MHSEIDDIPNHLIQCGEGGLAPWSVVCRHLLNGTARKWVPVPAEPGRETEHDWLCPACYRRHYLGGSTVDEVVCDLAAVCVHCVNELRAEQAVSAIRVPRSRRR